MSDDQLMDTAGRVMGGQYFKGFVKYTRKQAEERLTEWCKQNESTYKSSGSASQESQIIYDGAVAAWSACNRLRGKDIQITPVISPDTRTVDVGVSYAGLSKSGVQLLGVPTEGFTCTTSFPTTTTNVTFPYEIGTHSVQIRCLRQAPHEKTLEGKLYQYTPRGTISIQTVSDPFQLYFAEEWNPPAPLTEVQVLRAEVKTLKESLSTIGSRMIVQRSEPANCAVYHTTQEKERWPQTFVEAKCPPNSVRISGGCDFTCGMTPAGDLPAPLKGQQPFVHTTSVPTDGGWKCGAISNDVNRTYHAVAICLKP